MTTTDQQIAERLVETFEERSETRGESGLSIYPHMVYSPGYTAVRVLDTTLWDTEDEHDDLSDKDDKDESVETALAHAEEVLADVSEALRAIMDETTVLDHAFDALRQGAASDPEPVAMFTDDSDEQNQDVSIVVLRGSATIEMFRQWAERNGILHRDRDVDGTHRS